VLPALRRHQADFFGLGRGSSARASRTSPCVRIS
jgi:hypothetical protein